jgi:hypothetical protein
VGYRGESLTEADSSETVGGLILFDLLGRYSSALHVELPSESVGQQILVDSFSDSVSVGKSLLKFRCGKDGKLFFIKGNASLKEIIKAFNEYLVVKSTKSGGKLTLDIMQQNSLIGCIPLHLMNSTTFDEISILGVHEVLKPRNGVLVVVDVGSKEIFVVFVETSNGSAALVEKISVSSANLRPLSSLLINYSQLYLLFFHQLSTKKIELMTENFSNSHDLDLSHFLLNDSVLQYYVKTSSTNVIIGNKKRLGTLLIERLLACFGLDGSFLS